MQVIDNKRYDTNTAKLCGVFKENIGTEKGFSETLYRKRSGEYFLYAEGAWKSQYAVTKQGKRTGGEHILPLSYDDALRWAGDHMTEEEISRFFITENSPAPEIMQGKKKQMAFYLSTEAYRLLNLQASLTGKTKSELVDAAVIQAYK